jgi:hypothetical protein
LNQTTTTRLWLNLLTLSALTNMPKSDDHIYRCIDIIQADKTVSDQTIILMFLAYKNLIIDEYEKSKVNTKRTVR